MLIEKGVLIRKGAEAYIYLGCWFEKEAIFKYRIPKLYRNQELDLRIRSARTINEARTLIKVKSFGINVPPVYEIDTKNAIIVMKYIRGDKLKNAIDSLEPSKKENYLKKVGKYAALLHMNGQIHGDITTSNLIITRSEELFIIDFGLHETSDEVEDKSVDLHLFKRVLYSSHKNPEFCFKAFLQGYEEEYGENRKQECHEVIKNIAVVETRGRYVKKEQRL